MSTVAPNSRNASYTVRRIMTADVAQAVEALRLALADVDRFDDAVAAAGSSTRAVLKSGREIARVALKKRRAELDLILLGPEE